MPSGHATVGLSRLVRFNALGDNSDVEPDVRYVRSADGTNIATYTVGESRERPPFHLYAGHFRTRRRRRRRDVLGEHQRISREMMRAHGGSEMTTMGDGFMASFVTSRIAPKAAAGEILVPETARGQRSGKGLMFGDCGECVPKGPDEGDRLRDVRRGSGHA